MRAYSAVLLSAAGLVTALSPSAHNVVFHNGPRKTLPSEGASSLLSLRAAVCPEGMAACDATECMDAGAICCHEGNGAFCDTGYSCIADGCCPAGETCTGPPTGCTGGRELCGNFCVEPGACESGGGGGGSPSGGGSGSGSGGGSSGGSPGCPVGFESCDDGCMPTGSVCCHNGFHCDAGQTCTTELKCSAGGSSGGGPLGGGSSGGGSGSQQTSSYVLTSPSQATHSSSPVFTPAPSPTVSSSGSSGSGSGSGSGSANGSGSGGNGGSGGSGSSNGGGSSSGNSGNGNSNSSPQPPANAGVVNAPGLLAAALPLLAMAI